MTDTAQDYQKLLSDALQRQIIILGPKVALMTAKKVQGLTINDTGQIMKMTGNPEKVITQFLEEFRKLSSSLVKATMKPLLSIVDIYTITPNPEMLETETDQKKE
jgi:hypothetical protein